MSINSRELEHVDTFEIQIVNLSRSVCLSVGGILESLKGVQSTQRFVGLDLSDLR